MVLRQHFRIDLSLTLLQRQSTSEEKHGRLLKRGREITDEHATVHAQNHEIDWEGMLDITENTNCLLSRAYILLQRRGHATSTTIENFQCC